MNWLQILGIILGIASGIAKQTKTGIDDKVVELTQAAYDQYVKVHGTPLTFSQIEEGRTKHEW